MKKCVFVIDNALPMGLVANTCAVLSLSLGSLHPELVGADAQDLDGDSHVGITTVVMPVLGMHRSGIATLRRVAKQTGGSDLLIVDVTHIAQETKRYSDYTERLNETPSEGLEYLGICLYGLSDAIKSLTGNLPLLR